MAHILLIIAIISIVKYKRKSFLYKLNKTECFISLFFTIIFSGIHRFTEIFEDSLFIVKMGFPYAWMETHIAYENLFKPINYFAIADIAYRIEMFVLNFLIIYVLMIALKRFFMERGWVSDIQG